MTFTDPKIDEVARILHTTCHWSTTHEWADHRAAARYVVTYFTTTNTEQRISEAHSLGIKAGAFASGKTVEKLQSAVEQLADQRDALVRRVAELQAQIAVARSQAES